MTEKKRSGRRGERPESGKCQSNGEQTQNTGAETSWLPNRHNSKKETYMHLNTHFVNTHTCSTHYDIRASFMSHTEIHT